jgi:predicted nucleotidyltransferase
VHRYTETQKAVKYRQEVLCQPIFRNYLRLYGEQLRGVYLAGSYARGDDPPDPDVDVMSASSSCQRYSAEIKRTSEVNAKLSLDDNLSVSRLFMTGKRWKHEAGPLLRNVRAQGQSA